MPWGPSPRTVTLDTLPLSRLASVISTTTSLEASRTPPAPSATWGCDSTSAAWARSTLLCTSVSEARRITTTLSSAPVCTRARCRPWSSISTAANTNTTSAMPPAVNAVVSLRAHRLRRE